MLISTLANTFIMKMIYEATTSLSESPEYWVLRRGGRLLGDRRRGRREGVMHPGEDNRKYVTVDISKTMSHPHHSAGSLVLSCFVPFSVSESGLSPASGGVRRINGSSCPPLAVLLTLESPTAR